MSTEDGKRQVYVRRDPAGAVVSLSLAQTEDHPEGLPVRHPDVSRLLQQLGPAREAFVESDLSLIRALEDLIDVLIRKDVMRLTDLPDSVQAKLLSRRHLRGSIDSLRLLDDDETL